MKGGGVLLVIVVLLVSAGSSREEEEEGDLVLGAWEPIEDLRDPHVQYIAEFAVGQYNARAHAGLKLKGVIRGDWQPVAGINYRLVLATIPAGYYEAVVWEEDWLNFRNLTSFQPISKP